MGRSLSIARPRARVDVPRPAPFEPQRAIQTGRGIVPDACVHDRRAHPGVPQPAQPLGHHDPSEPSPGVFDFLIGGIDDRSRSCIHRDGPQALPSLAPLLVEATLALFAADGPPAD